MNNLLQDVRAYLEYAIDENEDVQEISRDLADRLGSLKVRTTSPPAPRREPEPPAPARPVAAAADEKPPPPGQAGAVAALQEIADRIAVCRQCGLHAKRTHTVPGQGAARPEILFIGEGPGEEEDRTGKAFVGQAGELLTKMIQAMGYTRRDVFIATLIKCRPPNNRDPMPGEVVQCLPYLKEQIAVLQPRVLVVLGAPAAKALFNTHEGISSLRGRWQQVDGIDAMPTFHPAYLLRVPSAKRKAWEDLLAVLAKLGKQPPDWTRKGRQHE